ncbi:N-acetylmuramoyl-L-alanine amidase [Ruixingdingia sedimenti]|uniref:N-acetylmuramoyl-L-alanine amidase n=1 Tax=Ruixingdingia sedimenti TaxID=3073604 RepID=A0ABU1F5C4_9RHOB|nr:N-acetylmuramoyl-L-alanine amidase [Xinfangfangia sp. LG-4]MDR5652072.1 N-acetylmuramoyl-L-alanine amidase [Xinfangfangia sp. LG-4]
MTAAYPSPNSGPRRDGHLPRLVVLHYTGMASCAAALARLCDPAAEVSAHYLIDEGGAVLALVPEEARAWHAGAGAWGGQGDVNSRSIGIELANPGDRPFAEPQMAALERLLPGILTRWQIPPQGVIAHSDLAPDRKSDPGPRFDWRRLARQGLAVWPDAPAPAADAPPALPAAFAARARAFGYPDAPPETLLAAFRLRFRPWARGPLDATDLVLADSLARRYPAPPPLSV